MRKKFKYSTVILLFFLLLLLGGGILVVLTKEQTVIKEVSSKYKPIGNIFYSAKDKPLKLQYKGKFYDKTNIIYDSKVLVGTVTVSTHDFTSGTYYPPSTRNNYQIQYRTIWEIVETRYLFGFKKYDLVFKNVSWSYRCVKTRAKTNS